MKYIQNAYFSQLLAPVTAATTARTANLDCQGVEYASFVINCGAGANTNTTGVVVALRESDDTTASNFATFSSTYSLTIDNKSAARQAILHVDLQGRKRYLQIGLTPDTTTNGAVLSQVVGVTRKEISDSSNTNNGDIVRVG
jgi:hypothetical protein